MKQLALLIAFASCYAQMVGPPSAGKVVKMLGGDWRIGTAEVSFGSDKITFDTRTPPLMGSIRSSPDEPWRRFLIVTMSPTEVGADFSDAKGRITHYRLRLATDTLLRFEDDPASGAPVHRLIYQKLPGNAGVDYLFQTGERVTDEGRMLPSAPVRPLSE